MKRFLFLLLLSITTTSVFSQEIIPLYPDGIKNHKDSDEEETHTNDQILWITNIQEPTLEIYLPAKASASGKAVVICPGGGYGGLAYDWEGTDIAKWFNSKGIAAFVLKYRMPNSASVEVGRLAPLQDAQRAIRIVRSDADQWNINPDQIGVIGFSAGGHLASTLGTHFDFEDQRFFDASTIDSVSARPDFLALVYPVITMDSSFTHMGSRVSLIGEEPDQKLIDFYSNEKQVSENTPPTFLIHSSDDGLVPVKNSIEFYNALQENGIYSEMHIYPYGEHGFALGIDRGGYLQGWTERLYEWIESLDL